VNLKAQHVDYNRFYIPDVTTLVDIQEDYLKWFLSKAETVSHAAGSAPLYRPEVRSCLVALSLGWCWLEGLRWCSKHGDDD
jgi:hypothetical protein